MHSITDVSSVMNFVVAVIWCLFTSACLCCLIQGTHLFAVEFPDSVSLLREYHNNRKQISLLAQAFFILNKTL